MATLVDQEFRARLAALGEKFAASVPVTMGKIAQALAACEASFPPDAGQLDVLHELLHGVAGSAGTFGFGELGQQCRRVEQMVRVVIAAHPVPAAEWAPIPQEVKRLLAWAEIDPRAPFPEAH
jgi:HPt (histidine-containing phosphotransfer) domain-containing protein